MRQKTQLLIIRVGRVLGFFGAGIILGMLGVYVTLRFSMRGHIYPGVRVGSIEIAGKTRLEAEKTLKQAIDEQSLMVVFEEKKWIVPNDYFNYNVEETVNRAYRYGRRLVWEDFVSLLFRREMMVTTEMRTDVSSLNAWIDTISPDIEVVPSVASITILNNAVVVENGSDGTLIDRDTILNKIVGEKEQVNSGEVQAITRVSRKQLNADELQELKAKASKLLATNLVLEIEGSKIILGGEKIVTFLTTSPQAKNDWEESIIANYVISIADTYDRESQNARFEVQDGKVKEFAPGRDGIKVQVDETTKELLTVLTGLLKGEQAGKVNVKIISTPPQVSTGDVNKLGIDKQIGRGESYYAHSIPGRIHNVGLTASRITSALIPPGEEFSFNNTVGEISGATGYAPAYVIKNGRTELGDGGGVCQVSTTVFRAALSAGLPITERWAHAYRVGYYEQQSEPGIDATIFSPSKDFKFRNDTPGHLLIQAINDPKSLHLIIEIYGTDDGRKSEISKVKIWGNTPPPPDLYQDDPTLPLGKIKQVDWSASGAKTTFDYKVTRNGETIFEKSFPSTYRAWQNVYLRGTKVQ